MSLTSSGDGLVRVVSSLAGAASRVHRFRGRRAPGAGVDFCFSDVKTDLCNGVLARSAPVSSFWSGSWGSFYRVSFNQKGLWAVFSDSVQGRITNLIQTEQVFTGYYWLFTGFYCFSYSAISNWAKWLFRWVLLGFNQVEIPLAEFSDFLRGPLINLIQTE